MNTRRLHLKAAAGFSLIELLVSMAIALVVTLAITAVLTNSEGSKRATTTVNDVNQTGAYLSYTLDRSIRSAGSGFSQNWSDAFGCLIDASKAGSAVLPLPSALAAPFASVPLNVRVAPIMIGKGAAGTGGDVIQVMAGTSGAGDTPQDISAATGATTATSVVVGNTVGYGDRDLVLLASPTINSGTAGCKLQQLSSTPAAGNPTLAFGGADYSRSGGRFNLTDFGPIGDTVAIQLGNIPTSATAPSNPPQMLLYGVGANNTLFSYDLLRVAGTTPTPIADGVVEMRALYGIDNTLPAPLPSGHVDTWIDPGDAGAGYTQALLTNGTTDAQLKLRRIVAVRVGLILRTQLQERAKDRNYGTDTTFANSTVTLFSDTPALQQTRTIVGDDNLYRYRTFEFTVPLRNALYAP